MPRAARTRTVSLLPLDQERLNAILAARGGSRSLTDYLRACITADHRSLKARLAAAERLAARWRPHSY